MVLLVLLGGQHIDHLGALCHQVLDRLAADLTHTEHLHQSDRRMGHQHTTGYAGRLQNGAGAGIRASGDRSRPNRGSPDSHWR
jgi:hypothetical protein